MSLAGAPKRFNGLSKTVFTATKAKPPFGGTVSAVDIAQKRFDQISAFDSTSGCEPDEIALTTTYSEVVPCQCVDEKSIMITIALPPSTGSDIAVSCEETVNGDYLEKCVIALWRLTDAISITAEGDNVRLTLLSLSETVIAEERLSQQEITYLRALKNDREVTIRAPRKFLVVRGTAVDARDRILAAVAQGWQLEFQRQGSLSLEYDSAAGARLLDTSLLLQFRRVLDDNSADEVEDPCLYKLTQIRRQAICVCSKFDYESSRGTDEMRISGYARQVWKELYEVRNYPRSVIRNLIPPFPPLYEDDFGLDDVINDVIINLFHREVGVVFSGDENTGHTVLGGVEGAGKSTLLAAFSVAAAVLFKRVTPLYWNYKSSDNGNQEFATPAQLLDAFYTAVISKKLPRCFSTNRPNNECDSVTRYCSSLASLRPVILPFLLFDEFQAIFVRDARLSDRIAVARGVCSLARLGGTYCVLAGSSARMRSFLFRSDDSNDECPDFPDFNGTLFRIHHVSALRTVDSLRRYITVRYPSWELSAEGLQLLLFNTGGIGRLVHEYEKSVCAHKKDYVSVRHDKLLTFLTHHPAFVLLLDSLTTAHGDMATGSICVGVSHAAIRLILQKAGYLPDKELDSWVDAGMAYIHKTHTGEEAGVQIAIPAIAKYFIESKDIDIKAVQIVQLFTMVSMIVFEQQGNAGRPMEQLIRPRVHEKFPGVRASYSSEKLSIVDDQLKLGEVLATEGLLDGKFLEWQSESETGLLDGVVMRFERVGDGGCECVLHGWRNKGGYFRSTLGGGNLETSRKIYQQDKTVGRVDDTYLHGILLKAEVGFSQLLNAVFKTLPHVKKASVRTLLITTSQNGRLAHAKLENMRWVFNMNVELVDAAHRHRVVPRDVDIVLLHGIQWIRSCLPEYLEHLLPPAWNTLAAEKLSTDFAGMSLTSKGDGDSSQPSEAGFCTVM